MAVKALIADDHRIFLAGLRTLLNSNDEIEVVGEAGNGQEAIDLQKQLNPDIIIMDINMPGLNGIEATKEILTNFPGAKILALSIHSGKRFVKGMLEAGASGYLLKDSAPDELLIAIQKIMKGEMYLSSTITKIALERDTDVNRKVQQNVLITKLHRPPVSNDIILRERIIEQLEKNTAKPLTLISAPAGYGKSMTTSQWLEKSVAQHAWISLDEEHNDSRVFLQYLAKAITGIFPDVLKNLNSCLREIELPSSETLSNILINDLDQIEDDFILVLDDYHHIKSESIHQLINVILRYPPQQMHLVLLCRRDPPLQLKDLRGHDRLTELRMQELAFTVPEIISFFRQNLGTELSESAANTIHNKTEGWIVGLRLTSLAIKTPEQTEEVLEKLKSNFFTSSDLLMEEVLENQPPELQKLLMVTSLCNRFSAELIDNLRQTQDLDIAITGEEYINWLKTSNLFLVSLDFENKWFRYHHLFQELLFKQLNKRHSKKEIKEFQWKIAKWHETQKYIDEAIDYYCLAGDELGATKIVERHAHDVFLHGLFQIDKWLQKIPEEVKQTRPLILLIEAWHAFGQFQLEKIPIILEKVQLLTCDDKDKLRLQNEISFFEGNFMYWMGEVETSIEVLSQALEKSSEMPVHVRNNVELVLNMALQRSGNYDTVIHKLQQNIRTMDRSRRFDLAYTYGSLTFSHLLSGKFLAALDVAHKMQIHSAKIESSFLLTWAYYLQASANFDMFNLKESLTHFKIAKEHRYSLDLRAVLDSLATISLIYYFINEKEQAYEIVENLLEYATELNDGQGIIAAQSTKARLDLLCGNKEQAIQWADSFSEPVIFAGIFFWIEVPWMTKAKGLIAKSTRESLESALYLLHELLDLITESHLDNQKVEVNVLLAITYQKLDQVEKSYELVEKAVLLGDMQKCVRPFIEAENSIEPLLISVYEKRISAGFIDKILTIRKKSKIDVLLGGNQQHNPSSGFESSGNQGTTITLTEREQQIVQLIAVGLRNKEIAGKLFVSEGTVKKHVYNMGQKFNTSSRVDILNKARAIGLIEKD